MNYSSSPVLLHSQQGNQENSPHYFIEAVLKKFGKIISEKLKTYKE